MLSLRGIAFQAALISFAGLGSFAAQPRLYFQETRNFRIVYYSPSHEYLAPVLIRSLENSLQFYKNTFGYQPSEPITVMIRDFEDFGNGSAGTLAENTIQIGMSPFSLVFDTMSAAERMSLLASHELGHIVVGDAAAARDQRFRRLFHGKIYPTGDDPVSIGFSFLASPRQYSPRWFHEGTATFFETWMGGGLGRALGGYDEMLFRSLVRDERYIYELVGLESEGTTADFQVGANSYLYGTRFMNYLARQYGVAKLRSWIVREKSGRAYFETEFQRVYGTTLRQEWRRWIDYERQWQKDSLAVIRKFPVTPLKRVSPRPLGSISRAHYDPATKSVYLAVRHLGKMPYLAALHPESGTLDRLAEIQGGALYDVTSLAFDPAGRRLFFTTSNTSLRGLSIYHLDTRKTEVVARNLRVGDLVYNAHDSSLWGIRHNGGQSSIVRLVAPYNDGLVLHTFPYATDLSDIDLSPDGQFLTGSLVDETGRQRLVRFRTEALRNNDATPETLYDFEYNPPGGFTHDASGAYLYGSSYTTGAANLFRVEIATKKLEALSNTETGLFRPLLLPGGNLLAFEYTADGFHAATIPVRVLEDVNAISYLGQSAVEKYPELKSWRLPSRSRIDDIALRTAAGEYNTGRRVKAGAIYPIVQGYKSTAAPGLRFNFAEPLGFTSATATLTVSPTQSLPAKERIHAAFDIHHWSWNLSGYYNKADFYDLFGPTKVARRGFGLKLDKVTTLLYDPHRTLDLKFSLAGYSGLDRLPEYQNIATSHPRFLSGSASVNFTRLGRTLGAVEEEKGTAFSLLTRLNYTGPQAFPRLWATHSYGFLTPIRNSSIWIRSAAGRSFGDRRDVFASFYFGGFGNNWVDKGEFSRYREYYSFPGTQLNAIGARDFARSMVEWTLPPIRFRNAGNTRIYFNWVRVSLFSGVLGANLTDSATRAAHTNAGAQADLRLVWFTYLKSTFSVGVAAARDPHGRIGSEKMISLKLN